jgi:glucans biosynthesis protein
MHGGAKGSGAPKGNQNALTDGWYSRKSIEEDRDVRRQIRQLEKFMDDFET